MLAIIISNLRRPLSRTIFTAGGIAVGIAMIVALLSMTQGLRNTAASLVHLGGSDLGVFQSNVSDPTASILPATMVNRIASTPEVAQATPLLLLVEEINAEPSAVVFGAKPDGFFSSSLVMTEGQKASRAEEIMLGDRLAAQLGLHPGQALSLRGRRLRIAGIYHSGIAFEDLGAVLALDEAQRLSDRQNEETSVVVRLAPGARSATAARRIEQNFPGVQVIDTPQQALRAGANSTLISKAILVIAVIALIVGAMSVTNTMVMAITERRGELGLLSTIGWSSMRVAVLILGEGVLVSVLGAIAGLLVGVIGGDLLVRALGVSSYVSPSITAWGLGRALLVGVAIGVLGGLYPAWRVTRMDPLKALSGT